LRIIRVNVRDFRGVKHLDWDPSPLLNCLIGPGDVGKTTILDAIEIALSPRYGFTGNDSDLHNCDASNEPDIRVTLVGLPKEFLTEKKYGLHLRGWSDTETLLNDEPAEGDIKALTIKATLDADSLEWSWGIYNDRIDPNDPPRFSAADARKLAPSRLGVYADRHLTWSRNSALSRMDGGPETSSILTKAMRSARTSFVDGDRKSFDAATQLAEEIGRQFLVPKQSKFEAQLDIHSGAVASGAVSLHDGNLPLRSLGSGSSRLMVAGLQLANASAPIGLIDEIEIGLEPYRIMRLLRFLQTGALNPQSDDDAIQTQHQVIMTTHSPVVVCELKVDELHCVRNTAGTATVLSVEKASKNTNEAQRHARANPAAFLAPRIIIGEGKTECGFLRGLDQKWSDDGLDSFAFSGVVPVDGTGKDSALSFAIHLLKLGYTCFILMDSDATVSETNSREVERLGGTIKKWPDGCDIEKRLFLDLPWEAVKQLVLSVMGDGDAGKVAHNLKEVDPSFKGFSIHDLAELPDTLENRTVFAKASTLKVVREKGGIIDKSWFKNIERGELLGQITFGNLEACGATPLGQIVQEIRTWVDG
jgi:putative ATP-dependent endonuclease of OLD family